MDTSWQLHSRQVFNFDYSSYSTNRNFVIVINNPGFIDPKNVTKEHYDKVSAGLKNVGTDSFRDMFSSLPNDAYTIADALHNSVSDYKEDLQVGKDPIKDETFFYIKEEPNNKSESSSKHPDFSALNGRGENNINPHVGNLDKWIQQFSLIGNRFDSGLYMYFESKESFRWNDIRWRILTVYKSILDGLFNKENGRGYFSKSLMSIQRYDYNDIVKILQNEVDDDFRTQHAMTISDIENAFNISKLVATNEIRKLELEDIQNDLIQLKLLFEKPTKDQNTILQIKDVRNILIEKLKSGIELERFLKDLGTSERELENKLEQVEDEDGVFEIRWKDR